MNEFYGISIEVPPSHLSSPAYIFGVRKSGSSILNSMMRSVCRFNGVPFVDIPGALFDAGVSSSSWEADERLVSVFNRNAIYGGFRHCPKALQERDEIIKASSILLVRDPRDAVVSEYFSNAFSHSLPVAGEERRAMLERRLDALHKEIDAFAVERAPALMATIRGYDFLRHNNNCLVLRYEDFIPNKSDGLRLMANHLGLELEDRQIQLIMQWADVLPKEERPTEFIRVVKSGDHLNKLKRKTIGELNGIFAPILEMYNYQA